MIQRKFETTLIKSDTPPDLTGIFEQIADEIKKGKRNVETKSN